MPPHQISIFHIHRGRLKGRFIRFQAHAGLRPTPARLREAISSIIAPSAPGTPFVDLFAGSGIVAFEALSLGFHPVIMVDQDPGVLRQLQDNAFSLDVHPRILRGDASRPSRMDLPRSSLLFADPPYDQPERYDELLTDLAHWSGFTPSDLCLIQHETTLHLQLPDALCSPRSRRFGRQVLSWIQKRGIST